jgi:sodium-dependent dicarboxylate transporter 2/3/5
MRNIVQLTICIFVFGILLFFLPDSLEWQVKVTLSILIFGILLWIIEPIPLGMTALVVMLLLLIFNVVPMQTVLVGFASPAIFLIIAGIFIGHATNETPLIQRITYWMLIRWGKTVWGFFFTLTIFMQIQALFIPATGVRVALMIPLVVKLLEAFPKDERLNKLLLVGTAYAGNISGTAILTAAIGNVLTIEILSVYLGYRLSYVEWFIYAFPIWILMMLIIPIILWKCYRPETQSTEVLQERIKKEYDNYGPLSKNEKKCIWILSVTILLWSTEPLHGLHPFIPALLAVFMMTFPRYGVAKWEKIMHINYDFVLIVGVTLSLGYTLIESGTIDWLSTATKNDTLISLFSIPWLAILIAVIFTHLFHLVVTNVATAIITLLPLMIGLSQTAGIDPVVISLAVSISTLYGFLLVVETMPNVLVHSTGLIHQKDFILPGIWATLAGIVVTLFVAYTWWPLLGFRP